MNIYPKIYPVEFYETRTGKKLLYERGYRFGKNNLSKKPDSTNPDFMRGFKVGLKAKKK